MQYVDYFGYGLHQLVYVSRMARPLDAEEVDAIVKDAAQRNRLRAVTGALLVCGDTFAQVLEGEHAVLQPLFHKIEADDRHRDVKLKAVEPLDRRRFARWGMRLGRAPTTTALQWDRLSGPELITILALSAGPRRLRAA